MKKLIALSLLLAIATTSFAQQSYTPSEGNLKARQEFSDSKLGIFLHWGIYSTFAQGEWYLHKSKLSHAEYKKAADSFYPHRFDAKVWVKAFKEAGAKYICLTSRHHDGFSMWDTQYSNYDIVDATPFKRDIVKELAEECKRQGIKFHLYYSHIDWSRDDYPVGKAGRHITEKEHVEGGWPNYYKFMNNQLAELITKYDIDALWFDGVWDHKEDATPFNWQLEEQYALIHSIKPECLIGNNHHLAPISGEDFQIFERDLPGENKAGYSGQSVGKLPLETCQTMNKGWGYEVDDTVYKSTEELIRYLVSTSGKGANLLLNIGPQPNGELPATSLERLKEMGEWLRANGETIYGTTAGDIPAQEWGVTTRKGERLFVHILNCSVKELLLPLDCKVKRAFTFADKQPVKFKKTKEGVRLMFNETPSGIDYIVELITK
jgi:alpha-L-fucosidase